MEKIPKYYLFRILLVAIFFQLILVLPPYLFILLKFLPQNVAALNQSPITHHINITIPIGIIHSIGILVYIILNLPFKILLFKKKKKRKIFLFLQKYTQKLLQFTPFLNSLIYLSTSFIVTLLFFLEALKLKASFPSLYFSQIQFSLIAFVASFLVSFVIYLWQENRVRLNYLPHFYSESDLQSRTCGKHRTHIYSNFLFSTLLTTFLPIVIMLFYITLNVSNINDVVNKMDEMTPKQSEIIYGDYYNFYQSLDKGVTEKKNNEKQNKNIFLLEMSDFVGQHMLFYYNAVGSFFMFIGIGVSLIVAIFYIILVTKLNVRIVVVPVGELMKKMKRTAEGEFGLFTIVRTSNEIGVLAESFNIMSSKLKHYFDDLMELNKNLEQKVIERTAYIEQQKEEITTQRDEIEEQRDEIISQRDEVVQQRDQIAGQNRQITDSINYAQNIQAAILPSTERLKQMLPNHLLFFRPRDIVSGDFYWLAESRGQKIVAAADCTGHGVPGAMMSMLGVSILNEIAASGDFKTAADILEKLRMQIIESLNMQAAVREASDGMDIALCIIDKENNELQYAGAYNPLYFFSPTGILHEIKATRCPIGKYRSPKPYQNHRLSIEKDTVYYMFSDGYRDQMTPQGDRLKSKGFRELLANIHKMSFEEQHEKLQLLHENWKMHAPQTDDILILGFKIH